MNEHHSEDISKHVRVYVGVFIALIIGTLGTVAASRIPMGHDGNIIVALAIAIGKGSLVALFFMHLVSERRTIYTVMAFTAFFFFGLMLLTIYAMHDFPMLPFHH
jgi:cytochrome c oxidase subunit IV